MKGGEGQGPPHVQGSLLLTQAVRSAVTLFNYAAQMSKSKPWKDLPGFLEHT